MEQVISSNTNKIRIYLTALLYPFVISSIACMFVLPGLFHCFDTGSGEIEIETLEYTDNFSTKNMSIIGYPLLNDYISLGETDLRSRTSSYTYFVPVVGKDWTAKDTVRCILKLTGTELDELMNRKTPMKIRTVFRNVLWEGIGNDVDNAFRQKFNMPEDVLLAEYGSQSYLPMWLFGIVFFFASLGSYAIVTNKV